MSRAAVRHNRDVGAWGVAIFSDDLASDIRGTYRELLEDRVPDEEATRRVIDSFRDLDADEEHVLWLALAAAQSQVGRLDETVKARALDVIDSGRGLELWEQAGATQLAKRKAVLAKLRDQLTGPQPPKKVLRRPWRHETDLRPGDVLSFTGSNGEIALLRVARVDNQRVGAAPVVEWLDFRGRSIPAEWRLRRLNVSERDSAMGPRRPATYRVARHRKKDPDWSDSGFVLASRLGPRGGNESAQAWTYLEWNALAEHLERHLTT